MNIKDLRKGDIVKYRNGKTNRVNKPYNYYRFYKKDLTKKKNDTAYDIMRVQRYKKILWFYVLKTIYRRV